MLARIFSHSQGKLTPTGMFINFVPKMDSSILSIDPGFDFGPEDFNDGDGAGNFVNAR